MNSSVHLLLSYLELYITLPLFTLCRYRPCVEVKCQVNQDSFASITDTFGTGNKTNS